MQYHLVTKEQITAFLKTQTIEFGELKQATYTKNVHCVSPVNMKFWKGTSKI